MKIFETSQVRELDRLTILNEPISSIDLMERASTCFADAFISFYPYRQQIYVFAGPGNNGGDALAVARLLAEKGYPVRCYLINPNNKLSPDCETNKLRLHALPEIVFCEMRDRIPGLLIDKDDIVIDGLFGSGLNRPLNGIFAEWVQYLNSTDAPIVSIDIPSGLFGEDNSSNNHNSIIKASTTFSFQAPKLSFLLPDWGNYAGTWEVLDIGLSYEAMEAAYTPYYYTTEKDIQSLLWPKRDRFAYKNRFGHALMIAGSKGKAGAAILSARACLRSGAGLVTAYVPSLVEPILQTAVPEAMTLGDPNEEFISSCPDLSAYTTIGIGPGLGTHSDTIEALAGILSEFRNPVVLDADALNILALHKEIWKHIPAGSILTPHVGEFERLKAKSGSGYERLQQAIELAVALQSVVVLKGAYSAVCSPDKQVWFNSTGNPGMATAGSGDVLTGIITGLLAQGYPSFDAARIGVYLHGRAGDKAVAMRSEESLIAGDIIEEL